jgi:hypothetical protein
MNLKYHYNFSVLTAEDATSYYLLGAFITDGCVYKTNPNTHACQISSCDQSWLNSIKDTLGKNLKLYKFNENYYGIRIIQNHIAQWFLDHGCYPRKTLTVELPKIPIKYMPDFLRGCIDGDGSLGIYQGKTSVKRCCYLISASKTFLDEIQTYLSSIGIQSGITEKKQKSPTILDDKAIIQKHKCYALYVGAKNCYKLVKHIYYDGHILHLDRKYNIAKNIIDFYEKSTVIDKRKVKPLNMGCKIQWPDNNVLLELINQSNVSVVARQLGVHSSAIRNRLKRRGLYDDIKKR